ncbi:MAG TPA: hypothetical protein VMB25_08930 [Bryobacteraceae bacterium]|nr:hypothetical protein [Bryobacteraceae bacterium]
MSWTQSQNWRPSSAKPLRRAFLVAVMLCVCTSTAAAVELKPETIQAFDRYIAAVEARLEPCWRGRHFLWFAGSPGVREQLRAGAIVTQAGQGNGIVAVKDGMIQDQMGAVFIPDTNLKRVLALVQDYNRDSVYYKPDVIHARIESRTGDRFLVRARVIKAKLFLSDVLDIDNDIQFFPLDARRVYSRSISRRVAEVSRPGKPHEHELPVGRDRGLLWRINGYWFFEEADGGVYVTCESVTLTRDVPFLMSTLLSPLIHELPAEAVRTSLDETRRAVMSAARDSEP